MKRFLGGVVQSIIRHLVVAAHLAKASVLTQAQYRLDFLVQAVLAFIWTFWNVAPLWLVFEIRPTIAGWTLQEAMLVMSAFLMLKAVLEGVISPNLVAIVEQVRTGTFDFVLLKPVDSQLLVSFSRLLPTKGADLLAGVLLGVWSHTQIEPSPTLGNVVAGMVMLGAGALGIYAIWMLIICTTFWLVKIDNLTYLFGSVFDAARWPISIFRGWVRIVLTFVLPVAVMTSFPAMAVLGRLDARSAIYAWLTAGLLLILSRRVWIWALRHYSSASS